MNEQQKSKVRILRVEEVGDFRQKRTIPRIRMKGLWLAQAGLEPNRYVRIENPKPGVLIVQLVEEDA